jgi:hypothetical protein
LPTMFFQHEPIIIGPLGAEENDVRPGCVFSLQTFGAYGANFNPHCHGKMCIGDQLAAAQILRATCRMEYAVNSS